VYYHKTNDLKVMPDKKLDKFENILLHFITERSSRVFPNISIE